MKNTRLPFIWWKVPLVIIERCCMLADWHSPWRQVNAVFDILLVRFDLIRASDCVRDELTVVPSNSLKWDQRLQHERAIETGRREWNNYQNPVCFSLLVRQFSVQGFSSYLFGEGLNSVLLPFLTLPFSLPPSWHGSVFIFSVLNVCVDFRCLKRDKPVQVYRFQLASIYLN